MATALEYTRWSGISSRNGAFAAGLLDRMPSGCWAGDNELNLGQRLPSVVMPPIWVQSDLRSGAMTGGYQDTIPANRLRTCSCAGRKPGPS
jgi:hypothetical protein